MAGAAISPDLRKPRQSRQTVALKAKSAQKAAKGSSLSLRVDQQTRLLIDRAADALGQTRTEFMLATARSRATEILLNQRLFVLNHSDWASFVSALDAPMPRNAKLKALLAREPIWDRQ
jgi:uncharacterized protein (DUF1778 family)